MNNAQCRKAYVSVNVDVDEEGTIHASSAGRTDSSSRSTKSCISAAQPLKKWEAAVFATPY